ncbi:MAG: methylenetetrahydrofolate reductase [Atopobiaceae bacterium]|nr:methylenetetrahydrofolate reductase [Atopobiaceae bacterium]MBR3314268.1 methylenetetrahydrofolate reductase [Atopobiaceae bacterium]
MRIANILAQRQTFSFEIFPPRGDLPVEQAMSIAAQMAAQHPDWISVTFSAGGSGNSGATGAIAAQIQAEARTNALAHLTCLGSSRADVDTFVEELAAHGVENVLALRGDRAPGREAIDFEHASDLIAHLKASAPQLCIGAACYPEGHVEASSLAADIEQIKAKQDAGADFLVTQLFFDNELFYRFREACVRARIKIPIVVGIMPFTSTKQIQRMAFTCGASIPAAVIKRLIAAGEDPQSQANAGIEYACEQLRDLAANGVDGLHIYSMNKPSVARATHDALVECGYLA